MSSIVLSPEEKLQEQQVEHVDPEQPDSNNDNESNASKAIERKLLWKLDVGVGGSGRETVARTRAHIVFVPSFSSSRSRLRSTSLRCEYPFARSHVNCPVWDSHPLCNLLT